MGSKLGGCVRYDQRKQGSGARGQGSEWKGVGVGGCGERELLTRGGPNTEKGDFVDQKGLRSRRGRGGAVARGGGL